MYPFSRYRKYFSKRLRPYKRRKTSSSSYKPVIYRNPIPNKTIVYRGQTRAGGIYGRFQPSGPELKYFDNDLNLTTINLATAGGTLIEDSLLCGIQQGSGANQRIGRKIIVKRLSFRMFVNYKAADDAPADNIFRIIIYLDKQANGASTNWQTIFASQSVFAFNNLERKDRFTILKDFFFKVSPIPYYDSTSNTTLTNIKTTLLKGNIKLNLPIEYSGSTNNVADMVSNNIGIFGGVLLNGVVNDIDGIVRIRYDDQ